MNRNELAMDQAWDRLWRAVDAKRMREPISPTLQSRESDQAGQEDPERFEGDVGQLLY